MILFDSDYIVDFLKDKEAAIQKFKELFSEGIAISVITYGEVYQGIVYGHERERHEEGLKQLLNGITVLNVNLEIAKEFAILRGKLIADKKTKHLAIPQQNYDLFIAATALFYNIKLLTNNTKHYKDIPGIQMYQ